MKFSNETIAILKNYAAINSNIAFEPGNILSTVSEHRIIYSRSTISETLESPAYIYDLSKFLGMLSLFGDDYDIVFEENKFVIKSGKQKVNYTFASKEMLIVPKKNINDIGDNADASFDITWADLESVIKAAAVLKLPDILFTGNSDGVNISVIDTKNPTSDNFSIKVFDNAVNDFKISMKVEHMKILPRNYNVSVLTKGLAQLKFDDISYWIACEAK